MLDGPVRLKVFAALASIAGPGLSDGTPGADGELSLSAVSGGGGGGGGSSTPGGSARGGEGTPSSSSSSAGPTSSETLLEVAGLAEDDPEREKLVLSEIEKFRLRQSQRDK